MNARNPNDVGWFMLLENGESESATEAIRTGSAESPRDWPQEAIDQGFASDESEYYERLHEATVEAARLGVEQRERADDQQLIHAIRAYDDCKRTANELTERVAEWAGTFDAAAEVELDYLRKLVDQEVESPVEERMQGLARQVVGLDDEALALEGFIQRTAPEIAPNLSALAGPELAARLISLAGGLDELAKKPAGTVQLLGAEDALFAHLRGTAPSPKHGIIYTHPAVRQTRTGDRGSAARALAGKLTIAARIDRYSGEYKPELEAELNDRIERIRARENA